MAVLTLVLTVILTSALVGVVLPVGPAAAAESTESPLAVTIDTIDTVSLNGSGPITVSGTVTDRDSDTWTNVHVYPFLGDHPITSETELNQAADTDEDAYVGTRKILQGHYATIDSVDPGETVGWSFTIPRAYLRKYTSGTGVYWFGVHALGPTPAGQMARADGRARTFLPLVSTTKGQQRDKVAVVLPLRHRVRYSPDGRIARQRVWTTDLGDDGRLGRLLSFGATNRGVTWLVDPAVLDAVRRLAMGNPPRNIDATDGSDGTGVGTPSASTSPSGPRSSPSAPDASASAGMENPMTSAERRRTRAATAAAKHWLQRLNGAMAGHEVLALPYGDPDLSTVATTDASLYRIARARGRAVLRALHIKATSAVSPASGYLDATAIRTLSDRPLTVVSDAMIRGTAPVVARYDRHDLITTSADAAKGGPAPGNRYTATALRQRLIAVTALRHGTGTPTILMLPDDWSPSTDALAAFTTIDDSPWARLTSVSNAVGSAAATTVRARRLVYPEAQKDAQLSTGVVAEASRLMSTGRTLQRVLTHNDRVAAEVQDEALTSVSYAARPGEEYPVVRSIEAIENLLGGVRVSSASAVLLSSNSGSFSITVRNGLDQAVSVRLRAISDSGIRITVPAEVTVPANGSSTQLLQATSTTNGVHAVRLELTDSAGKTLGGFTEVSIKTTQVSTIIWWFIGAGLALLFAAIAVRLVRRIRAARGTPPSSGPDEPSGAGPDRPSDQAPGAEASTPQEAA
ncbi:MAG: DUF6049 family protein [Nocardioides sp.]|uniref:DUF6049 family protein n=1 Tax=Nocardioides sp. TaxID=35761 RepID=UPI0039E33CC8